MKIVFCLFLFPFFSAAVADGLKYPNVDSLSYWNLSVEAKDSLITYKKQLADAEGMQATANTLLVQRRKLFEKQAISEQELREYQWKAKAAGFKIRLIREAIAEKELFEKLYMLRYQWAKEEKAEVLSSIAETYTEQWRQRAILADTLVEEARAELDYRQWVFDTVSKLVTSNAATQEELIHVRDTRDEILGRLNAAIEHAELARKAEKDSQETQVLIR